MYHMTASNMTFAAFTVTPVLDDGKVAIRSLAAGALGPGRLKWHFMTTSNLTMAAFTGTPVLDDGKVAIRSLEFAQRLPRACVLKHMTHQIVIVTLQTSSTASPLSSPVELHERETTSDTYEVCEFGDLDLVPISYGWSLHLAVVAPMNWFVSPCDSVKAKPPTPSCGSAST
jgi:hypothetical protein